MADALPRRAFLGAGVRLEGDRIVVTRVLSEGGALREHDVLLAIDGHELASLDALGEQLRCAASREHVVVRVRRDDEIQELSLGVAPMPSERVDGASVRYDHVRWRGHRIRTITTTPSAPIATVVLLQGIYCQSVDVALAPDAPLAQLVRAWSARGLATVRVERPGIGDSEGPPCGELDLHGELELYEAALDTIDPGCVILFGHSLGGVVAASIAHRAAAVVAYGAPGEGWTATVRAGIDRQLRLFGATEARIGARLARFDANPFEERHGRALALHRQLDALDLGSMWESVRVPVLVLIGEHDWVTGERAQRAIAERAPDARVVELSGLDHSFTRHASLEASLRDHGRGVLDERIAEETARLARQLTGG